MVGKKLNKRHGSRQFLKCESNIKYIHIYKKEKNMEN